MWRCAETARLAWDAAITMPPSRDGRATVPKRETNNLSRDATSFAAVHYQATSALEGT